MFFKKYETKCIYTVSLKRSGQHAIINWLCEQNKPAIHFNACQLDKKNISYKSVVTYKRKKVEQKNIDVDLSKFKLAIYSFEDILPIKIKSKKIKPVTILREPRNLFASRMKVNLKTDKIQLWKAHVDSGYYQILFDLWFTDINYRKMICDDLSLRFNDHGLNEVYGKGTSSFNQYDYNGKAQEMDVLNRWKEYRKKIGTIIDNSYIDTWNRITNIKIPKYIPSEISQYLIDNYFRILE